MAAEQSIAARMFCVVVLSQVTIIHNSRLTNHFSNFTQFLPINQTSLKSSVLEANDQVERQNKIDDRATVRV